MKKSSIVVLAILFGVAMSVPVWAGDQKSAGDLLLDAALGAGEGAIVGKASGGKAGKGALVGAGTSLAREALIKPILQGGISGGGQPQAGTVTRSRVVEEEIPMDPYTKGYQDGFKEGYNQGYKAGLAASQR